MVLLLGLTLWLTGCGSGDETVKKPPVDDKTITDMLVDMHLLEARADELKARPDSIAFLMEAEYDKLYKEYGVSEEDFQQTFEFYQQRPEQMDELYQGVIDKLVKKEVEIKSRPDEKPDTTATGQYFIN